MNTLIRCIIALLSVDCAVAELCQDFIEAVGRRELRIELKTSSAEYAPGERVLFRLRIENLSLAPKLVPLDGSNLFDRAETMAPVLEGNPPEFKGFQSIGFEIYVPRKKPCPSTLIPKVLLPGDSHEILVSDVEKWLKGERESSFVLSAQDWPGPARVRMSAPGISLGVDFKVLPIDSFDLRCLAYAPTDPLDKKSRPDGIYCRQIVLIHSGLKTFVLMAPFGDWFIPKTELPGVLTYMKTQSRKNLPPGFTMYERVLADEIPVEFESTEMVIPGVKSLAFRRQDGKRMDVPISEFKPRLHLIYK